MSDIVDAAVKALNDKLDGGGIDGSVKFVIEDEGSVRIDEDGARADDGDADCTMTADRARPSRASSTATSTRRRRS